MVCIMYHVCVLIGTFCVLQAQKPSEDELRIQPRVRIYSGVDAPQSCTFYDTSAPDPTRASSINSSVSLF